MKLTCVGSGSTGNCYVLEQDGSRLILDAGCPWREVLKACDFDVMSVAVALLTHEHGDHTKYVKDISHAGIPIFSNQAVKDKFRYVRVLPPNRSSEVGSGWKVIPFEVPHTHNDGTECQNYAYLIERNGEKLLYMTDWMYCRYNLSKFNINHFLIAVNYTDLDEDDDGNIRHVLQGHSSLETATDFLKASMTDACRSIIACHISSRNADADRIIQELTSLAPETVNVTIAKKGAYIL